MNPQDASPGDGSVPLDLRTFVHDMRQSLFAIHMGVRLLERARNNEAQFAELCKSIDAERQRAGTLLDRFAGQEPAREKRP